MSILTSHRYLFTSTTPAFCKKSLVSPGHGGSATHLSLQRRSGYKSPSPRFKAQLELPALAPATSAVYGALLLGGGIFAYTRSGSKGSLVGGLSGGVLMATAYFLMQVPETRDVGDALGFGSAFLFSAVFGIRLAATRKLVPAGPLLGLSVSALVVFISAYLQDRI